MSTPFSQFAGGAFQPPPPPQRPGTNWTVVAAVFGGSMLLALLVCGGVAYLGFAGISSREPTDAERQVVITAGDLVPFGARPDKEAQREVWKATRNIDGSLAIEYEYDPDLAPGPDDPLAIISSVELHGSESSARESLGILLAGYKVGFGFAGVQWREQEHQMAGVDQSHFALIESDGQPVGNMVVVREGTRLHGLLVIGLYFDDPADLEELLRPTTERSAGLAVR